MLPKTVPAVLIWFLAAAALLAGWVLFSPYQSHFGAGLRVLGDFQPSAYWGVPKDGRGDEWATYLPMLKQAMSENFPSISALEPYREKLRWFIGLPSLDASLALLPNQALYWFLPGHLALSAQGIYYNLLFVASFVWLLRNFGVRPLIAVVAAVSLLFSQIYQVWWTSNFPALGASILPFAIVTSQLRPVIRYTALSWAIGHLLFGQIYPPFYISLAFALGGTCVAMRPEMLRPRNVLFVILAAVAPVGLFLLLRHDFVSAVAATSYPGLRVELGGGSSLAVLLGMFFPTITLSGLPFDGDSVHELSVGGTILPLLALAALTTIKWDKQLVVLLIVSAATMLILTVYATVGFPEWIAKVTGFSLMPGRRAQLGASALAVVVSAIVLSKGWSTIRPVPILLAFGALAYLTYALGVRQDLVGNFVGARYYAAVPIVVVGAVMIAVLVWRTLGRGSGLNFAAPAAASALVLMSVVQAIVFGSFNPVMDARRITSPVDSQVTRDWAALYRMNKGQPLAVVGNYGHLLRGESLAALEAIHLANVDPEILKERFPQLSDADRDEMFNRFNGVAFDILPRSVRGATNVFAAEGYAVAFPHTTTTGPLAPVARPVEILATAEGTGTFNVWWRGVLDSPAAVDAPLELSLPCPTVSSWLTRFPLPMQGAPLVETALQGIGGRIEVAVADVQAASACVDQLGVTVGSSTQTPE